jgi:hypothetical protein
MLPRQTALRGMRRFAACEVSIEERSRLSATWQIVRELGWEYLAKLSRQKVMQVQSANDAQKNSAWETSAHR